MANPTATLTVSSVGDRFVEFYARLVKGSMTKITSAAIVYGDNTSKPNRKSIVDLHPTERSDAIFDLTDLFDGSSVLVKVGDLTNGSPSNFILEVNGQTSQGLFIRAVSPPVRAIPVGPASPPVVLVSASTGKTSFTVTVARHSNDNGANIRSIIATWSKPTNSNGEIVNEIN